MKFEKVDHIAIAVDNLDSALETYEAVFGVRAEHREYIEDYDVEIATLTAGNTALELIEGKSSGSPIRKFVETRGAGLHHVAFAVADIRATLDELRGQGVTLIDDAPRRGKSGSLVAFIHPKSTERVLYELVQLED
jgi:methylmalonyl-CoA/ethylmalonyl-CoA epimerase